MAKKLTPIGAKPTPEQQKEAALRSFITKRNAVAEGIMFNAVRGLGDKFDPEDLVTAAVKAADLYLEKAFGLRKTEE